MEKMEERCFAADRDIAYIVLKTNMGMNEKLAKEWAAAVQAAAVHACGLVRALIEHVIYDYFMLERYSEALMEAELQQYNRNIEQLGEPLRIRKGNGTGESFYSLVKMVNDEGCAHLPEEQKEWFTIDMVYYNVLYEALKTGDAAWAELKPAEPSYLYHLGLLYLYGGDLEKAEKRFERMRNCHRCEFCHYGSCYEALRGLALVRLMQQRWDEAEELFKKVLEINPYCGVSRYYLKNRRKW